MSLSMTSNEVTQPAFPIFPERDLILPLRGALDDMCQPLHCPPTVVIAPLAVDEPDLTHIAVLGYN